MTTEITTKSATATQEAAKAKKIKSANKDDRPPDQTKNYAKCEKGYRPTYTCSLSLWTKIVFASTLLLFHLMYRSVASAYVLHTHRTHSHTQTHKHIRSLTGSRYYERAREPPKYFHLHLRKFVLAAFCIHSLRVRLGLGCLLLVDFFRRSISTPILRALRDRIDLASWWRHAYDATTARTKQTKTKVYDWETWWRAQQSAISRVILCPRFTFIFHFIRCFGGVEM